MSSIQILNTVRDGLYQGWSVRVNRVSPANTFRNEKQEVLLSWFSGIPYTGTWQNRSHKMHP
jgi:hypothetical protein